MRVSRTPAALFARVLAAIRVPLRAWLRTVWTWLRPSRGGLYQRDSLAEADASEEEVEPPERSKPERRSPRGGRHR